MQFGHRVLLRFEFTVLDFSVSLVLDNEHG